MKQIYILDEKTFAALARAHTALRQGTTNPEEMGRLIEILLARATMATLEMDRGESCLN